MTRAVNATRISESFCVAFGILLLATGVAGCASFKEVRAFATLSSKAASHDGLTRDYIAALDRRKQYQPEKFHTELEAQKARREAQRASLDLLQQTMTDYMQGLDGLASAEIRTYDKSLEEMGTDLNRATLLDFNESQAVAALSTILARAVTAAYRLHELRKLIYDANPPLQEVIKATRRIVEKGIVADLQVESALVRRYYDNFMLSPDNPAEPVAMALAREARVETLSRVDTRIQSAQSYAAVLEKIAQGHQYLYEHRDMIGNDELDKQFKPYIDELRAAYKNLLDVSR
jgi:hypothetical protein